MRLSGLVVAALLLVSATLFAQHTSGSSGSSSSSSAGSSGWSSSGASHSSYSGGSSSSTGSHNSSNSASHVASTGAAASHPSPSTKLPSAQENAAREKKGFRSFLRHPFRKPKPVQAAEFKRPVPCLKAPCPVCPSGQSRSGNGACVPSVVASNVCPPGQFWNGFACGVQYRFNDCSALAEQLAARERQMRGQNDPGHALFYRLLRQQYESCLAPYGSPLFSRASWFDALADAP